MKKILLSLFVMGLFTASYAQVVTSSVPQAQVAPVQAAGGDMLKFKDDIHDFDEIPQGKPVYYDFYYTNLGVADLKLDNVQASCGCTTPEWNKDPVKPGATGHIKVGFNASAAGYFEKYITITYNNTSQTKQIRITGTVWKAPDGSAPVNTSVDFLKKQTN